MAIFDNVTDFTFSTHMAIIGHTAKVDIDLFGSRTINHNRSTPLERSIINIGVGA